MIKREINSCSDSQRVWILVKIEWPENLYFFFVVVVGLRGKKERVVWTVETANNEFSEWGSWLNPFFLLDGYRN